MINEPFLWKPRLLLHVPVYSIYVYVSHSLSPRKSLAPLLNTSIRWCKMDLALTPLSKNLWTSHKGRSYMSFDHQAAAPLPTEELISCLHLPLVVCDCSIRPTSVTSVTNSKAFHMHQELPEMMVTLILEFQSTWVSEMTQNKSKRSQTKSKCFCQRSALTLKPQNQGPDDFNVLKLVLSPTRVPRFSKAFPRISKRLQGCGRLCRPS